jgi:hypothetical protein
MELYAIIDLVAALLQQRERLTYRVLKRQFGLDHEALEDLKEELIKALQVARDENGEMLVWVGGQGIGEPGNRRIGNLTPAPSLQAATRHRT